MTPTDRRLALHLSPYAIGSLVLSTIACGLISFLKLDTIYLLYAIGGFGVAAGWLQWRFRAHLIAQGGTGRNTLGVQLYGMVILTALCAVPGILLGRAIAGTDIWTGH